MTTLPPAPTGKPLLTTRRAWRRFPARRTLWFDWRTGRGVDDTGTRVTTVARPPVGVLLDAVPPGVEMVNLTGGRPNDDRPGGFQTWLAGALPFGWEPAGHFVRKTSAPVLRFHCRAPLRKLEMQRAAVWFGEGDYTPDECRAALDVVGQLIGERFGAGAMRVRPASTGQECFLRTVPDDVGFACLPDELATLLRQTGGQGRIEHFPHDDDDAPFDALHASARGPMRDLVEYDMRFAYAALCRELPAGRFEYGPGDGGHDTMVRGRFLVDWRVPGDWRHAGLLPMFDGGGGAAGAARWRYPRRPGERGAGWVDAVELHLARRHGWRVDVRHHLVWPDRARPLDRWARELCGAYDVAHLAAGAAGHDATVAGLVRAAVRNVCLFTIGAFQGRPFEVTHTAPLAATNALPADARNVKLDGDVLVWSTFDERGGPALVHPEWSATVWARCRARMLSAPGNTGALYVPFETVVAIHTDALYLTFDPQWHDDGNVGRLRRKASWPGPHQWPGDDGQLTRLVRQLRRETSTHDTES